jgi:adenosylmethionine-8-amino-7-oxononanoate aminotransferase
VNISLNLQNCSIYLFTVVISEPATTRATQLMGPHPHGEATLTRAFYTTSTSWLRDTNMKFIRLI